MDFDIQQEADKILGSLQQPTLPDSTPEQTQFQQSKDHYGVFYRLDLIEEIPVLLVIKPDRDKPMMHQYQVWPNDDSPLRAMCRDIKHPEHYGTTHRAQNHILFAVGEILKELFWCGTFTKDGTWKGYIDGSSIIVRKVG